MKRYKLMRAEDRAVVHVYDPEAPVLRRLKHIMRHSPDGFEWGYDGSGPSDLALALVADVEGEVPRNGLYLNVRRELVAQVPHAGGEITEAQVLDVLSHARAGEA